MPDEEEVNVAQGISINYLGTPQTEESVYNKLRERGFDCRIWPARFPELGRTEVYANGLAPSIVNKLEVHNYTDMFQGTPTDPKRFNEIDLQERELSYGRSGFALQFMLDTSLSDAEKYPLKTSDLIVMPLDILKGPVSVQYSAAPDLQIKNISNVGFSGDRWFSPFKVDKDYNEYEGAVLAIDPAGRGKDQTGYAVVKQLHGKLFCTACGGLDGGYNDATLLNLAKIALEHHVHEVIIEANFGDGMFQKLFEPVLAQYHPCTITEVRHNVQKEKRIIDTLEPVMNSHRLVMNEEIVEFDVNKIAKSDTEGMVKYSLFYQMTRLTKERGCLQHDDKLEALSMAVNYWVQAMARDSKKAKQKYHDKQLEKELKVFMDNLVSSKGSGITSGGRQHSSVTTRDRRMRRIGKPKKSVLR
jgi:hypothetical protein